MGITKRVAVYLSGDTLQYRLKERFPPAYSTGDTTVYLFTDTCLVPAFDDT